MIGTRQGGARPNTASAASRPPFNPGLGNYTGSGSPPYLIVHDTGFKLNVLHILNSVKSGMSAWLQDGKSAIQEALAGAFDKIEEGAKAGMQTSLYGEVS